MIFHEVNETRNCVDERKMNQNLKLNKNVKSNLVQFHTYSAYSLPDVAFNSTRNSLELVKLVKLLMLYGKAFELLDQSDAFPVWREIILLNSVRNILRRAHKKG